MKPIDQGVIDEAVRRLRVAFDPTAIYHFGSSSRGQATLDSDLDLLVVIRESGETFHQRATSAYRALRGLGVPVDVQVYTAKEFRERAALPVSFERSVAEQGRLLHVA